MTNLFEQTCEACRADAPRVTEQQKREMLVQVPEWTLVEEDNIERLRRVYPFKHFVDALAFTNQLGELAEQEGHHPAILTEWGRVTLTWWTHKIKGLHVNDFIMAAKSDRLFIA